MKFADIDYDLSILDKYLQLTDKELTTNPNTQRLDILDKHFKEYMFNDSRLSFNERLAVLIDIADDYFTIHYECNDKDDYFRRNTYLQHLTLAKFWKGAYNE